MLMKNNLLDSNSTYFDKVVQSSLSFNLNYNYRSFVFLIQLNRSQLRFH